MYNTAINRTDIGRLGTVVSAKLTQLMMPAERSSTMRRRLSGTVACLALIASACAGTSVQASETHTAWHEYGGSSDGAQYSSLDQINPSNVTKLEKVWTYRTGDDRSYVFNPIVVDGVMYVLAENNSIVALDAVTGKRLWSNPTAGKTTLLTTRGINYWESPDRSERRLLFSVDNYLEAIDARTGKAIASFGREGRTDLREGLGRDANTLTLVQSANPGRIFEDLLILGSATNEEYASGPGDIRAYNVRSGRLQWTFHTIPHPGEPGYETWPKDAWKTAGGANAWAGLALDEKRGIVYVPTASPKYNFYGANRRGANLFGNCLLALNARTGKLIWYYQMVHHDIWDYDNATTPMLTTVEHDGKAIDVVAQVSKIGFVWVFDRENGKPLWPIEERAVPKSGMPGEETWPTQPFPLKPPPFARQSFTERDINPYLTVAEREQVRQWIAGARNQGLFTPPTTENTVEMPGNNGGANYAGAAVDPARGDLYVVSKDLPAMLKLSLAKEIRGAGTAEERGREIYDANCSACHGANLEGQPPAVPSLMDAASSLSDEQIVNIVKYGKAPMPAVGRLSQEDLDAVLTFIKHPAESHSDSSATGMVQGHDADPASLQYKSGFGFMFTRSGLPVISPPWMSLTAYNLNAGTIRWKVPLDSSPELAGPVRRRSHIFKINPMLTAGGLIFLGSRDGTVRALDAVSGKLLWHATVDAGVEGMPAVYEIDGREYIVFCAAGGRAATQNSQQDNTGGYVAFALPQGVATSRASSKLTPTPQPFSEDAARTNQRRDGLPFP
jgi:quinoprotein glucose dehydrogenase